MKHNPLKIARWALLAGFGLMVAIVCLPNPQSSTAWKIAEGKRYEQRFPELNRPAEPNKQPDTQLVKGEEASSAVAQDSIPQTEPIRTAQRQDRPQRGRSREGNDEELPARKNLAPDPEHLDLPQ
jgi:hypothetical protein